MASGVTSQGLDMMIRIIAKLFAVIVVFIACLPVQPSSAETVLFVSASGSGTACTQTAPCSTIDTAISALPPSGGRVLCLTPALEQENFGFSTVFTVVVDCPSASWLGGLNLMGNEVFKLQHIGFSGLGTLTTMIRALNTGGTLIFEDCVFEDVAGTALDIEPTGLLNLVIRNSRISNNASGMLLKPSAGGSIKATFDHVVTTSNNGGGIKSDSTNGVVNLDITDSEISNNGGNGINLVGSANQNMLNVSRTIIAKNAVAGLQVNGATTAALVDTTLFDTNTSGATSVVGGGHVLTYGNNHIVGSAGSGFTGTAPSQ
jgi:hypothetical protein